MIAALKSFADRLLGRGDATITVPSFDGALKPNQILETAETVGQFDAARRSISPTVRSSGVLMHLASPRSGDSTALSARCVACRTAASRLRWMDARSVCLRHRGRPTPP
jgi:hypothetical protein